ncbi:hypothetical protein N9080_04655 [Akkermansiaceae bacterium]|nr:hypothetical protein [Akkermansiaceae bacterium]
MYSFMHFKTFVGSSLLFFVLFSQGCDDSKVKPPVEEGPQKEIVLIEKSLGEIEGFLGSSLRIENGDPEVRSYTHKGFNIQVSYAEGKSVAVEFRKVEQGELETGTFGELDWDLILRLCGAKAGEMEGLVSYGGSSLKKFKNSSGDKSYIFGFNGGQSSVRIVPLTGENFSSMKKYIELE